VGVGDWLNVGVPVPKGTGELFGVPDGEGTAVLVGVGDTRIAVKKASEGIVQDAWGEVNAIEIVTSLLIALGLITIENTASPSEVVVVVLVSDVPSGHCIVAVAVAPETPTGLPSLICVNLPKTLTAPVELKGGVVSVAQPPQKYGLSVGVGEPMSCPSLIVTVTTGVPGLSWLVPLLLQATIRMLKRKMKEIALHFIIRLNRVCVLS
jgi:hypothetical protein